MRRFLLPPPRLAPTRW